MPHKSPVYESPVYESPFGNGYELVDGCEKRREFGERFQVPPQFMKDLVRTGFFVELRVDSNRFSAHEGSQTCQCPSCSGEMTSPILSHPAPDSLVTANTERLASPPARGWGEDFWVQIECVKDAVERKSYVGCVDNELVEGRFHGLKKGVRLHFESRHILAIHPVHRLELLASMEPEDVHALLRRLNSGDAPM
ncbi:MAG: hypothetical protein ACE361_03050 [Aureliella sp.]